MACGGGGGVMLVGNTKPERPRASIMQASEGTRPVRVVLSGVGSAMPNMLVVRHGGRGGEEAMIKQWWLF